MNKQYRSKPAHAVQAPRQNNFHRRSPRPIAAAEPHASQTLNFLQQAQREAYGRRAICISRLVKVQVSICRALGLLRNTEAGIELEICGDERRYLRVAQ